MPEGIQDALLIYNPTSGGRRQRRFWKLKQAVPDSEGLRNHGGDRRHYGGGIGAGDRAAGGAAAARDGDRLRRRRHDQRNY